MQERDDFDDQASAWVPKEITKEFGLFNVFKLNAGNVENNSPLHYSRKDYYKISLIEGTGKFLYAGNEVHLENYSIIFFNLQVPYGRPHGKSLRDASVCTFRQAFFNQFENINNYSVFQPGSNVYQLNKKEFLQLKTIYQRMFEEIEGDFVHKYDLLRTLVYELVLYTMKLKPTSQMNKQTINASVRIATLFTELLERQFSVGYESNSLLLRSASDYARYLNIHVNHLNKALKETYHKATSQLIIERILQEAKVLLIETSWTVSEIAYALGYTQVTHFNKLFKKYMNVTPTNFRKARIV